MAKVGDLIRIGEERNIDPTAVGVVFRINRVDEDQEYVHSDEIIKNPNGWSLSTISHRLDWEVDEKVHLSEAEEIINGGG